MSKSNIVGVAASQIITQKCLDIWRTGNLSDLGAWATGTGFPIAYQGHSDLPYLFSKVGDMNRIGNEKYINSTENTIDDNIAKTIKAKVHPAGTVIFPKIGGAIATNKRRILVKETAIDNNVLGITPNSDFDPEWLYYFLKGIDFSKYQSGTSVPAIKQSVIGQLPVPLLPKDVQVSIAKFLIWLDNKKANDTWDDAPQLPQPLNEQRRMVARIEELATKVEQAQSLREKSVAEVDVLRFSSAQNYLDQLPNIEKVPLSSLVDVRGGGTPSKQNPLYWEGTIPWFSPKDMKSREMVDSQDHISESAINESSAKLIDAGAILVVVRGMILSHTFPVAILKVPAAINQDMKALIPVNGVIPEYLSKVLWAYSKKILGRVKRSTQSKEINTWYL